MDQYFTTREGAIRRLVELRRKSAETTHSPITVVGHRNDGVEVSGIECVLFNVRVGRIVCFVHTTAEDSHIVFIS